MSSRVRSKRWFADCGRAGHPPARSWCGVFFLQQHPPGEPMQVLVAGRILASVNDNPQPDPEIGNDE